MTRLLLSIVVMLYAVIGLASAGYEQYDWHSRTCEWRGPAASVLLFVTMPAAWPFYWTQRVGHPSLNDWRCGDPTDNLPPIMGTYFDNRPECVSESKYHVCTGPRS